MKKCILTLSILFLSISSIFGALSIDDLINLSKNIGTLEIAWEKFLDYLQENPSDTRISEVGELISAKIYLYNKYKDFYFVNELITENIKSFCINLGVLSTDFRIPKEDTEKIIFIFPQIPDIVEEILTTGNFSEPSYKYLYKLEGLNYFIIVDSYDLFVQKIIENSIKLPIFFDEDMKHFVLTFVPKNNFALFEEIINKSKYIVNEENYLGIYSLLSFLNDNNALKQSPVIYSQLDKYFSLKKELTSLNNSVFFVEKQELSSFISQVFDVGNELKDLQIEKTLLSNMYYSLLKTLNSKLESIQERVPIEKDFEELTLAFNNEINGEILKLQNNVVRIQSYPVGKTNVSTPLADQKSEEKAQNNEKINFTSTFLYVVVGIGIVILFVLLYFELFPSYNKINFLCNLKFGKYAVHLAEKLVIKDPGNYKNFLILARAYEVLGDYTSSINAYRSAINLKDKNVNVFDKKDS